MINGELDNERRAVGFLGEVEEPREFNGKYYTSFLIRYVRQGGWYRVFDYRFRADPIMIDLLQMITPNSLVIVTFEINSKINKGGFTNISLKATGIIEYGESAPGWVWKLQDWTRRTDVVEIKKEFPDTPDIEEILKQPKEDRLKKSRSPVNNGYTIADKVQSNKTFADAQKIKDKEEEDNLPF